MKEFIKQFIPLEKRTKIIRIIKRLQSMKHKEIYSIEHYDIEDKSCDVFYGYYDVNPFHGDYFIYNTVNKHGRLSIHVRENQKNDRVISETNAWCWQQGCRLRWLSENEDRICWNNYSDGSYYTVIHDLHNDHEKHISWPLYDIDRTGRKGLTLNFVRLGYMRPGYGYTNMPFTEELDPLIEGIGYVDLNSNSIKKVLTYKALGKALERDIDYKDYYINHLSFNPSGNKFLFFFIKKGRIHQASLFIYDIVKDILSLVEDELSVSHYCWIDDDSVLITAYDAERNCRYYIYDGSFNRHCFLHDLLTVDGHPTWVNDTFLITDTYPDSAGFQKLLLVNPNAQKVSVLADLYTSEKRMGEQRTDLHPRIDTSSGQICIDSNVSGIRKITILKVMQDGKTI